MKSNSRISIKNSIVTRLLRIVFSFYLVIAISVTVGHMVMEYRYQKENISRDLEDIQKTFEKVLAVDMWQLNQESLSSTIEGLLKIPVIVGVTIQNVNDESIAVGGTISQGDVVGNVGQHVSLMGLNQEDAEVHSDELYKYKVFQHQFPIMYTFEGEISRLGNATLYSSSSVVFRRVKFGFLLLVFNAVVKTTALWLIFLWFSNILLRKPLATLVSATGNISLENLDTFKVKLKTSGRNELRVLDDSFNSMIGNLKRSINERKRLEVENEKKAKRLHHQQEAVIRISEISLPGQHYSTIMEKITVAASRGIDVERISIWLFDDAHANLICQDLYLASTREHSRGMTIEMSSYPAYAAAVESKSYIAADDALSDLRTFDFAPEYLKPLGITSMLDAPVRKEGQICGVLCLEHVGESRVWMADECGFAERVAEQVTSILSEMAFREVAERLDLALKGSGSGMWDYDLLSDEWIFDECAIKILGANPKTDAAFNPIVHPDDLKQYHDTWDAVEEGRESLYLAEFRVKKPTGQYKWLMEQGKIVEWDTDGTPIRATGTMHDISARKNAEIALQESLERMELALKGGDLGMWDYNIPSDKWILDERSVELLGAYPKKYAELDSLFHPDDIKRYDEAWNAVVEEREPFFIYEYRIKNPSGQYKWLKEQGKIVKWDSNGEPVRASGTIQDITEKKLAELDNTRLQNLLQNITDSMPSVLVGLDAESKVIRWNKEAERATGISADKAHGRRFADVFPDMAKDADKISEAIQKRIPIKDEKVPRVSKGEVRYSDITVYPLGTNGADGAVVRIDDVTDRVRIEETMIQTEKMMSVGGLAAGMAHEINNPLGAIIQNVQVIKNRISDKLPKNREVAESCGTTLDVIQEYLRQRAIEEMIDSIMQAGLRASKIIKDMLAFSRQSESKHASHELNNIIDRTIALAENDYDLKNKFDFRQVEIIREYEAGLPRILCEETKVQQVVLNILKNGAQAMADYERAHGEKDRFIIRIMGEAGMARIEIEDNGPGMDERTRKKVFEPFFTTKAVGIGTGLGLSVSYFIITDNHQGTMAVESSPGIGTKFIIRLPFEYDA